MREYGWTQQRANSMLALVAMAWGSSYLLMKIGLDGIPPFCIIALRFGIAFIAVSLLFFKKFKKTTKRVMMKGAVLGLFLFGLFAFLMHGLQTTSASNGGFLTSTTVVLVPIFHAVIKKKMPDHQNVLSILLTMTGICLLTLQQSLVFHSGDILCLAGAAVYAVQILLTDKFAQEEDGMLLGIWQLGFAALYGVICTFMFETPTLPSSGFQWIAILGLAFVCSAFGFVMQPMAQKYTTPEHTGLLFALEPVFSAVFSYIFLHETLSGKGYMGAMLVMAGVVAASVVRKKRQPVRVVAHQS